MKISLKCLPQGSTPYHNTELPSQMMIKLFESTPYLIELPQLSQHESSLSRTLENINWIKFKDNKLFVNTNGKKFKEGIVNLDADFAKPNADNLEKYAFSSAFLDKYLKILQRVKPKETVVSLTGAYTLSQMLSNEDLSQPLIDKNYRKIFVQLVSLKALWIMSKIKQASIDTMPVIIIEEPVLNTFGSVKRNNEDVTQEVLINMMSKVIQKIHEFGGAVCVQCFEKCDWQIPIEASADIISFDAYNNPNNLNIIPEKVNNFLAGGGRINWGFVPVKSEQILKSMNVENLSDRLIKTIENLIDSGVSERLAYNHAMVSVLGNMEHLPIIFAEKALILSTHLAKRIPFKS